ncbi:hypothetical protein D9757_005994 [Collybiopsis confluens]|uniref:Amidohydrolase 3 domain-containing protein n=1 Tax=Collybiopsis confluens TaxID=2823264 RepID=A0A8H5HV50_9AGAR|nr:hypothetical protein D9757_005994 [Collybiopsis confluens]
MTRLRMNSKSTGQDPPISREAAPPNSPLSAFLIAASITFAAISVLPFIQQQFPSLDIPALPFLHNSANQIPHHPSFSYQDTGLDRFYALCSKNGSKIYTVDIDNNPKECLVVFGTDIVDTGSIEEVTERCVQNGFTSSAKQFRGNVHYLPEGAVITPSFSDYHSTTLILSPLSTFKAVVKLVRSHILSEPELHYNKSKWIYGWGFDITRWPVERWPTYVPFELDPVTAGRPIWLTSKDGHAIWTSEKVIELAEERMGIGKPGGPTKWPKDEDIMGGKIVRDGEGRPMDNAQNLISVPTPEEDNIKRFRLTIEDALANGITSMHDAGFSPETLPFYQQQAKIEKLPIRMYAMHHFDDKAPYWGNSTQQLDNNRLRMRSVKLICDGAMRSGGAYLYEPYSDDYHNTGFMRLSVSLLNEVIPRFLRDGWQINAHAIGDRANGILLDAFEKAKEELGEDAIRKSRSRVEHAQILREGDAERFGKLGLIASVQPTHVTDDMWYGETRLGPKRVKGLYAFRSILNSGARITLGSDIPVESINPLNPSWRERMVPEQKLTRIEALRGITIDPAYASFSEDILGSLEPGKKADFVVLDKDIMNIDIGQVLDTKVLATVLDGEVVFGDLPKKKRSWKWS